MKSFRLDCDLTERLDKAARRTEKSESGFVSDALLHRLTIDPLIPAFQEMSLFSVTFQCILGAADAEALEASGSFAAQRNVPLIRELFRSYGHELSFKEFVTNILEKHSGWFSIEGDPRWNGGWMILRHGCDKKWSRFLRGYLLTAHGVFSEENLEVKVGEQFVEIRLALQRAAHTTGYVRLEELETVS